MNLSYNWLKTLLDFELNPRQVADRLTMIGHEVEEVEYLGQGLEQVRVGRVLSIRPHPKADRLRLVAVDYADREPVEVVCGAPNVMEGRNYPLALVGAVLPGGMEIKKARVRGIESCGMLCSERELGLSDDVTGLMELDDSLKPGTPAVYRQSDPTAGFDTPGKRVEDRLADLGYPGGCPGLSTLHGPGDRRCQSRAFARLACRTSGSCGAAQH